MVLQERYHLAPDGKNQLEGDLNDLVRRNALEMVPLFVHLTSIYTHILKLCCSLWYICLIKTKQNLQIQVGKLYRYIDVSAEPATEAEPEPVTVADPANTFSDAATSSGFVAFVIFIC